MSEIATWLIIGAWCANVFAVLGAFGTSKHITKVNLFRVNLFYTLANLYSTFYFIMTLQYPYIVLQLVFLFFSVRGVIKNYQKKLKISKEPPHLFEVIIFDPDDFENEETEEASH